MSPYGFNDLSAYRRRPRPARQAPPRLSGRPQPASRAMVWSNPELAADRSRLAQPATPRHRARRSWGRRRAPTQSWRRRPHHDPLCRMPLLPWQGPIRLEDLVDDRNERVGFGRAGGVDRRYPGGTECSRIFDTVLRSIGQSRTTGPPLARSAIDMARSPHMRIEFHKVHLPAFSSFASGAKWRSFTPRQSEHPTASVTQYVSEIHMLSCIRSLPHS
jgi:hypothetical protein